MDNVKCKLCGKILTNPESIKLGFGTTCYRIYQLQQPKKRIEDEVNFLKLEVKFLKKQLFELKTNGVNIKKSDPIERIKTEIKNPEQLPNQVNMVVIIKELKVVLEKKTCTAFKKDFRFNDDDIGVKTPEEIAELLNKN